jgi:hypothetical protein
MLTLAHMFSLTGQKSSHEVSLAQDIPYRDGHRRTTTFLEFQRVRNLSCRIIATSERGVSGSSLLQLLVFDAAILTSPGSTLGTSN